MSVVSLPFLLFCTAVFVLYYILPKKLQWVVLLVASMAFYCYSGVQYALYIIGCAAVTYAVGRLIEKKKLTQKTKLKEFEDKEEKKAYKEKSGKNIRRWLVLGIVLVLLQLVFVKYTGFIIENLNLIISRVSTNPISAVNIIAPLGCSYYTFTMISYLADVYRSKTTAQNNFLKYLLFVSYFPQIIQGPIPRYNEMQDQLFEKHSFSYDGIKDGLLRVIYGVFKKIVIAEPLGVFVTTVLGDYQNKSGLMLLIAGLAYSMQIYADFSGYTDVVSGVSELFGIKLPKNFNRPFFAQTIPEFWRRWHMSLSSWFREYVFYALSSSKALLKLNKNARKLFGNGVGRVVSISIPVLSVWLLTGLWHGASWNMILWGLFHGVLIMLSIIFEPTNNAITQKLHIKTENFSWQFLRMCRTTFLCTIGRIISISPSVAVAFGIIKRIFTAGFGISGLFENGLSKIQFIVVLLMIAVVLIISLIQEYWGSAREWLSKQNCIFRWVVIFLLLTCIFTFGTYGINAEITFIYEQF